MERLLAEPRDVLTFLKGDDDVDLEALVGELAELHPDLDLEVRAGGQPHYRVLISAE